MKITKIFYYENLELYGIGSGYRDLLGKMRSITVVEPDIALSTRQQEAVCQPWRSLLFIHYVCNCVVVYTLQHKCLFTILYLL